MILAVAAKAPKVTSEVPQLKYLVITSLLTPILMSAQAHATTLKDFEAKSAAQEGAFVADYIDKMTTDLWAQNPQFAQAIRDYFAKTPTGKHFPDGLERLNVEIMTVDELAKEGKADPAKIQVEGMIVYIVKQKFQPQSAQK